MAKINHHNFIDSINDVLGEAKNRGVLRLSYNSENWDGDKVTVGEQDMVNFGTCGYMGLENHPKVIEKTVDFTKRFGAQFSVSRTYLTDAKSFYLEELLQKVFDNNPVITFTSTSMAHTAVLPIVVGHDDAIILDQQAHISIATAAQLMAPKGVPISIIRHSNLEMLEHKIKQLRNKHNKIWYMIDGVYSMYGDIAPIDEINKLMQKYEQLHLYVDDAHGMSWYGKHGCGRIFKEAATNQKTVYITTMAKGYGAMGGIAVFPNEELHERVLLHGGPLSYSHPLPPPMLGAAIASAEIHLSDELVEIQKSLHSKLEYTSSLLAETNIPLMSHPGTPIYYIGTGQPVVGYNLNKRILDEGFYVTLGIFPGVPVKNTGLRFTLTNHNTKEQIKDFIDAISYHYPKALAEEGKTYNDVRKAFKLPLVEEEQEGEVKDEGNLKLKIERSIIKVNQKEWDACFHDKGNFDWSALQSMEEAFSGNELPEENWEFYYLLIHDEKGQLVLASYFTIGIFKDDLVSPAEVSLAIEEKRKADPYYLCSKAVMMGSLFSEGDHLYVNRDNSQWKEATKLMVEKLFEIQNTNDCNSIFLRDFRANDTEIADIFHDLGFFKMNMPNSNVIEDLQLDSKRGYIEQLTSSKDRRNIRYEVVKHSDDFNMEVKSQLTSEQIELLYSLFMNVSNKNHAVNLFQYPQKLMYTLNENSDWEFIVLSNKQGKVVAIICCYKGSSHYYPVIIGVDYDSTKASAYKQLLYRTVMYSREKKYKRLFFGITADTEKKKLGAKQIEKVAFINVIDQFNMEAIDKINI